MKKVKRDKILYNLLPGYKDKQFNLNSNEPGIYDGDEMIDIHFDLNAFKREKKKIGRPRVPCALKKVNESINNANETVLSKSESEGCDDLGYTYRQLLDRVYNSICKDNPHLMQKDTKASLRLTAPLVVPFGSLKTIFKNLTEMARKEKTLCLKVSDFIFFLILFILNLDARVWACICR